MRREQHAGYEMVAEHQAQMREARAQERLARQAGRETAEPAPRRRASRLVALVLRSKEARPKVAELPVTAQ